MRGDLDADPRPTLAWADHQGEACLRLAGLAPDALDLGGLSVVAGEHAAVAPAGRPIQPAAGRFVRTTDGVDFIPRFPFLAGGYSLVIAPCTAVPDGFVLTLRRDPAEAAATAAVVAVHPDVETVPFNLLKLYVQFSEPMAEGSARGAVRVENAETGEPLDGVFLDMDPELWDPSRRRLTLLLDPGRIKRGLAPHEEAGYPLAEGVPIRLTIDATFRSASGAPLQAPFTRAYDVGPALRRPVDPADWRLNPPVQGSLAPLRVRFDRPLDHAMLRRAFQVLGPTGRPVGGAGSVLAHEMGWSFQPSDPWRPGEHQLIVEARLEDLAGNSLRRVFDRDLTRNGDFVTEAEHVALNFTCRPGGGAAEA